MAANDVFDVGDTVESDVAFIDLNLAAVDPSAITVSVTDPAGAVTDFVFGVDGNMEKRGVGYYAVQFPVTSVGIWRVKWEGTGAAQAVGREWFSAIA